MNIQKAMILLIAAAGAGYGACAQNVSLNILSHQSGLAEKGQTVLLEVTVCNHDATAAVAPYKLKPQVSVPAAVVTIPESGHRLPQGWAITANKQSQLWLTNGTDTLAPGDCRTIYIALLAVAPGGPSTISANMLFSNGKAPGAVTGVPLPGDSPADNGSTTTIKVHR